jgi:hypothetical protein
MTMSRRSFSTTVIAGTAASRIFTRGIAATPTPPKARNHPDEVTRRILEAAGQPT